MLLITGLNLDLNMLWVQCSPLKKEYKLCTGSYPCIGYSRVLCPIIRSKTAIDLEAAYRAEKYSLDPLGSGFMVTSPGFHPAGQTSSGFSFTYCIACSVRMVSSTLLPKAKLLIVECWMTPCRVKDMSHAICLAILTHESEAPKIPLLWSGSSWHMSLLHILSTLAHLIIIFHLLCIWYSAAFASIDGHHCVFVYRCVFQIA